MLKLPHTLLLCSPLLFSSLFAAPAHAGSYEQTTGTIVDPILFTSGAVHSYSGPNLGPFANLIGEDLRSADLFRADLSGATLLNADLRQADLSDAERRVRVPREHPIGGLLLRESDRRELRRGDLLYRGTSKTRICQARSSPTRTSWGRIFASPT